MRRRGWIVATVSLLALPVVILGAGGWLFGTEAGARFVIARLVAASGNVLTAESITGTLAGGVEFERLHFEIDAVEARADSATATLDLPALLGGRVVVRDLYVSPVTVVPREPSGTEPFEAADLPVAVALESVVVAGVEIDADGGPYEFGQLTLTLGYDDRVVDLARFETRYGDFALSTQTRVDLNAAPSVDGTVSVAGTYLDRNVLVGARVTGVLPEVDVDADVLEPLRATVRGPVVLNDGPRFDLNVTWEPPGDSLVGALPVDAVAGGTGRAAGRIDDVEFELATAVTVAGAAVNVGAAGQYLPDRVEIRTGRLTRDEGEVDFDGTYRIATGAFDLRVDGRNLDPDWVIGGYPGRIVVDATFSGRIAEGFAVASDDLAATGEIRGFPFTAAAAGSWSADGRLGLDRAEVAVGGNTVTATGSVGTDVAMNVDVTVTEPAALIDGLGGRFTAGLTVSGPPTAPRFSGTVAGTDVVWDGTRIATVEASGSAGIAMDAPVDISLTASDLRIGGRNVARATGTVTGTEASHVLGLELMATDWSSAGRFEGGFGSDLAAGWSGRARSFTYSLPPLGTWTLTGEPGITLRPGRFELDEACLAQAGQSLCAALALGGDDVRLRVRADDIDLALLDPLLPDDTDLTGRYSLDIDVAGPMNGLAGRVHVAGGPTRISIGRTGNDAIETGVQSVTADAEIDTEEFSATAVVAGLDDDRIDVTLGGRRRGDGEIALDGDATARWDDLAPLSVLSAHVGAVSGGLTGAVTIGGTLRAPRFDGRADLAGGRIELPLWGVAIESISGAATSGAGAAIDFEATGMIDESPLSLSGSTMLTPGLPTSLKLSGERVHVVQIADADVYASPDLAIDVDLPTISVAGAVTVPSALISIAELPAQAVRPSADTVVHDVEGPPPPAPVLLDADIDLVLGDDVRYKGSGLDTKLDGGLRLRYSTLGSTDATGTLGVTGSYEAFGQTLTLDRGELVFTGPLENPTLNIRAVRKIDPVTVGIDLTGTLEAPVSRIFSEPAMAEADAVSYLLFGRPLAASADAPDQNQLRNAAVALGLRQAVPVIQRIGDSLGFDEFGIESTEVDAGELMAGKFLSPKLYIRYTYGLFNRIGGLLLQYKLNDRLSLETRSGEQKSMDLLYTKEKD